MLRALIIATALAARSLCAHAQSIPAKPDQCVVDVALTIQAGHSINGPWSFGPAFSATGSKPDAPSPIVIEQGASLDGPITLELCDGKLRISRP
jgi:hypothetical protein